METELELKEIEMAFLVGQLQLQCRGQAEHDTLSLSAFWA